MDPRIITKKLEILRDMVVIETRPISPWRGRAAKDLSPGEYEYLDDWHPVQDFSTWPALQTVFLSGTVKVPEGWDPARTFMTFNFLDMEGMISIGGKPWAGLDPNHNRIPLPGPGQHEILLEFLSVPRAFRSAGLLETFGTFGGGRLILINPDIEAAYYDLRFAFETVNAIHDERRKALLDAAVEEAVLAINFSAPRERLLDEIAAARKSLAQRVAEIPPDPEGGRMLLTGHTHIDTAWLWPIKETIRKCARTFSTACRLMEAYPDYHFSCSQAQLYEFVKILYPSLFEEIKHWVAEGRWENAGAMWVEADANVTSGESLIRQILYGLRFFREEFGTRPTMCWLPDVFGYNAGMPQILAGCGVRSFWTWKLHWQARNPFPYYLFWWQGVDGSRVLAHIPRLGDFGYNGNPTPRELTLSWERYVQKGSYDEQLLAFGHGDGGGGTSVEMMEFADRASGHYPGLPACRQGTAEQFFADVLAAAPELPTWVGELYLETHRGTYTTQAQTKLANRRCELTLREAEIWGVIAGALSAKKGSKIAFDKLSRALDSGWKKTLLHQFHDILPGSSIGPVYLDTAADHAEVLKGALAMRDSALGKLAQKDEPHARFRVFNSLSWKRNDVASVTVPDLGDALVARCDGQELPAQVISRADGKSEVVFRLPGVPSIGATTIEIAAGKPSRTSLRSKGRTLESDFYLLELGGDGCVVRLLDKRHGREVIPDGEVANRLQLFQDGPERESAWNVHATFVKREYPWEGDCSVEIVEQGPVRAVARVTRSHRNTKLVQDIILYEAMPRIDFKTHVEWHEKQTMLKVAFPLAIHASHATFEVQFGAYERPNHRNTSWEQEKFEVCAQRWADLSEGGYGVSLLNDCKYGHDVLGNVLRLTLLRGTEYPDPEADQGSHDFTYSLLPHAGDWREGEAVRRAYELNAPLLALPTTLEGSIQYVSVTGPAVLETLKPAEDGHGVIMRLYEPNGSRGAVTVEHRLPFAEVIACSLVEENEGPVSFSDGKFSFPINPYQVRTFRLK